MPNAIAIAAHPDDIEFMMAGTLLLLRLEGWTIHYLNLSTGHCGSATLSAAATRRVRRREAQRAAVILGACWHAPLADDMEILYEPGLLRRLAAVVREVNPRVVLTHSPQDYMEDHVNTCRLAVSAAFVRGMRNYQTLPRRQIVAGEVTIYHAMPHGLRDPLGHPVPAGAWVNTTRVQAVKREALAAHASQKRWLDRTQGMDSYLRVMDEFGRELGRQSRRFTHAEGWRRRLHYGLCGPETDPLRDALGSGYVVNRRYRE